MGGQNHQPTNRVRLIAPSAWLSQRVGEGFANVLRANSELENAIIVGMNRLHVEEIVGDLQQSSSAYLSTAIDLLGGSLAILDQIEAAYDHLLKAADLESYRGNPLASQVSQFDLAGAFAGNLVLPAVNRTAWNPVEEHVRDHNILATLKWEAGQFALVKEPTEDLIRVLDGCRIMADRYGGRAMVEAVECNEVALRREFARVFSLWNHLHAMFLYSALMMTELFYRTNAFGSLLSNTLTSEGMERQSA